MSSAVLTLNHWNLEYYQTMKTTEQARLSIAHQSYAPRHIRILAEALLYLPFRAVTRDTAKLVALLEKFEAQPASLLLDEDVEKMPQKLQDLFKKMCNVIRLTDEIGLSDGFLLRTKVSKLGDLSQQIKGYADRFADAQIKLRSRVPEEQIQHFQESFAAYGNCKPTPDELTEDTPDNQLLRF
jgi:hypothetical protein